MKEIQKKLEAQIKILDRELNEELPEALKRAIELGDLKENAEYHAAKERQSYVQAQVGHLRYRLAKLSLVDLTKVPKDRASYGSTLVVLNVGTDEEITYRLVTSEEADVKVGLISTTSPIGKGLMGSVEGDEVEIKTPRGLLHYEVVKLTTLHDKPHS